MKHDESFRLHNIYQPDDQRDLKAYNAAEEPVALRCPHCLRNGTFHSPLGFGMSYIKWASAENSGYLIRLSVRVCPNPACTGLLTVLQKGEEILAVDPPELIDFDATNLPQKLLSTLQEAISCHAVGAYRASAMMVRRMLEEVCELDEAAGKTLHERLASLRSKLSFQTIYLTQ